MTTTRPAQPRRHPFTPFRKDNPAMFHIEFRFGEAEERIGRFRAEAERERFGRIGRRRFRHRIGETFIRFGHRIGGEAMGDALVDSQTTPAWLA